jgi:hypothetical protein
MTDPSRYPDSDDVEDAEPPPEQSSSRGMPRWVKVTGLIAAVLVVIFVAAQLLGVGGDHGPRRHGGDDAPPAGATENDGDHTPPPDMDHDG